MPFVSFLSVCQAKREGGRKIFISISLLARLNYGGTDGFYRPLLDGLIESDDEDEV